MKYRVALEDRVGFWNWAIEIRDGIEPMGYWRAYHVWKPNFILVRRGQYVQLKGKARTRQGAYEIGLEKISKFKTREAEASEYVYD